VGSASINVKVNGGDALLIFTRKDPVQSYVKEDITLLQFHNLGTTYFFDNKEISYRKGDVCSAICLTSHTQADRMGNVVFTPPLGPIASNFTVDKELVLIGGTPNTAHGGIAPTETLIVRGAAKEPGSTATSFTNLAATSGGGGISVNGLFPTDRRPAEISLFAPTPVEIRASNSTFVVETESTQSVFDAPFVGGTLGQYSSISTPCPNCIAIDQLGSGVSHVDGAITATSSNQIPIVNLTGGVTLDQGTKATIGTTDATNMYFLNHNISGAKLFEGSLLAVIDGPNTGVTTSVTVQDRLLGVYDGSTITTDGGNKALLSVLDAKLKGPSSSIPLIDIAAGSHFDREGIETPGSNPNVTVTSAVVIRSTIPLDGALLEASGPLFALTNATMTTTSHFADLAGLAGNKNQSLVLGTPLRGDAMVALNASQLLIQNGGNLLNLNAATATVTGYLFSLNNSSTLTLSSGALFSVTNGSSLNLNGNAFGVFGSGANTLSITNNFCTAACGQLVNSAGQAFTLPTISGILSPILVAGTTKNVMLPNSFNVFATTGAGTPAAIMGDTKTALFKVDGTSTLTINGTKVN